MLSFGRDIMTGTITLKDAQEEQIQLNETVYKFGSSTRPQSQNKKDEKILTLMTLNKRLEGRQMSIKAFKGSIFSTHPLLLPSDISDDFDRALRSDIQSTSSAIKPTQGKIVKTLPPAPLLQRLSLLFAQVKACNTPENHLSEIRNIVYSSDWEKSQKRYTIIY